MRFRILFISGCPDDAQYLSQLLQPVPLDVDYADSLQHARKMLPNSAYRVILTATNLPDATWLDVLEASGDLPVIVTDPHADGRLWAEALNRGAYDLLAQPFFAPEVQRILGNAATRPAAVATV